MESALPLSLTLTIFLASIGVAGCGGNIPASPPTPVVSDLTGTWTQVGGTRTWTLTQGGLQAGGPSSFSQDDNPSFGAVTGSGGVMGAIVFGAFTFGETYERLSGPSLPSQSCYIDVSGQLAITGNSMTGSYTEVDACAGVHLGQFTTTLTMQRK